MRSAPPFRGRDHQHEGARQHRADDEEHAAVDAAEKEDAHRDRGDDEEGAHVGLGQQQQADDCERERHRQHGAEEVFLDVHAPYHVARGIHRDRQLAQLGWLEAHDDQPDPAARAVHALADEGQQHEDEQQQRGDEDPGRELLPDSHRYLHDDQRDQHRQAEEQQVPVEKIGRRVARELGVVGHRHRSAVDHHEAERQQGDDDADKRAVEAEQARRLAAVDADPLAHRNRLGDGAAATVGRRGGRTRRARTPRLRLGGAEARAPGLEHVAEGEVHATPFRSATSRTAATKTSARCA